MKGTSRSSFNQWTSWQFKIKDFKYWKNLIKRYPITLKRSKWVTGKKKERERMLTNLPGTQSQIKELLAEYWNIGTLWNLVEAHQRFSFLEIQHYRHQYWKIDHSFITEYDHLRSERNALTTQRKNTSRTSTK
jgi:hypothetical protein